MNTVWNKKWKSALIWLSAYLNFIAFVLVGGYFYTKNEDEELQKTTKFALIVTLIFTGASAFLSIFNYIGGFSDRYYSSAAYDVYSTMVSIVGIIKILVYAAAIVYTFVKKDAPEALDEKKTEEN